MPKLSRHQNKTVLDGIGDAIRFILRTDDDQGEMFNAADGLKHLCKAVWGTLQSPNVCDSNLEPANVVDAIDRLASGAFAIATAIKELAQAVHESRKDER